MLLFFTEIVFIILSGLGIKEPSLVRLPTSRCTNSRLTCHRQQDTYLNPNNGTDFANETVPVAEPSEPMEPEAAEEAAKRNEGLKSLFLKLLWPSYFFSSSL